MMSKLQRLSKKQYLSILNIYLILFERRTKINFKSFYAVHITLNERREDFCKCKNAMFYQLKHEFIN